ncbi:hypothetical protein B0J12DRAFT_265722 [Macrophomina phaseolina]|uniref:Secreted protein n=1 Tax=Macrophomina phaseolina TaxID=35725 RepID=A0ABQ8G1I6_9PEZI|nr:hypothetical protein B0J12DRAFT_265722 [Macrophomina phaseolina]
MINLSFLLCFFFFFFFWRVYVLSHQECRFGCTAAGGKRGRETGPVRPVAPSSFGRRGSSREQSGWQAGPDPGFAGCLAKTVVVPAMAVAYYLHAARRACQLPFDPAHLAPISRLFAVQQSKGPPASQNWPLRPNDWLLGAHCAICAPSPAISRSPVTRTRDVQVRSCVRKGRIFSLPSIGIVPDRYLLLHKIPRLVAETVALFPGPEPCGPCLSR